ncbi:MAG: hypothetical protein ABSF90_23775 [Syntrophobacteraceae bacterium]
MPPGGETKIQVNLNPNACKGGAKKSVLVMTNDKNSYFVVSVSGRLK